MITLHQYPGCWELPSLSPFCVKVETYLKMAGITYKVVIENNPRRGPKGKMPVLKDGEKIIPDSGFILEYLKNKFGNALDAHLTEDQQAIATAMRRMIEENLYFVILYSRWIDPVGRKIISDAFKQFFPRLLAPLILAIIRRNLRKQAYEQGIGRHTREEIYSIGKQDIHAIATLLGSNFYFFGDKPTSIDATIYAFLSVIIYTPIDNPLREVVCNNQRLMEYVARMK